MAEQPKRQSILDYPPIASLLTDEQKERVRAHEHDKAVAEMMMAVGQSTIEAVLRKEDNDLPELTDEMFKRGTWRIGGKEVTEAEGRAAFRKGLRHEGLKRGGPVKPEGERKVHQGLRLSPDVLESFKATGPGWQTRIDEALREWLNDHPKFPA